MLQRTLPVQPSPIPLGKELGAHAPSKARALFRTFIGHFLRLMRLLGRFAAAGGSLT
jgi:hypothetical protein